MTIKIKNFTPFANLRYSNTVSDGREFGVVMVKGTFEIGADGNCLLAEEQEPINFTDGYHAQLNTSSLRHPSEFVPYKPGTDVIINAIARSPSGQPEASWPIGIRLISEGKIAAECHLTVFGERYWVPEWKRDLTDREKQDWKNHKDNFLGWKLSSPIQTASISVRYELAFGGTLHKGIDDQGLEKQEILEYNPIGIGWLDPEWSDHTEIHPAPRIEYNSDPITEPYKRYYPAGLGPIPPAWLPRRPLGGTYDKHWLDKVWPKWPDDYQFSYHQSAAAHLATKTHVVGNFDIDLLNIGPTPGKQFRISYQDAFIYLSLAKAKHVDEVLDSSEGTEEPGEWHQVRMNLDTIHVSDDLKRLFLVWRACFDETETDYIQINHGRQTMPRLVDEMRAATEPAPHPSKVAKDRGEHA